jgi:TolB-like protein
MKRRHLICLFSVCAVLGWTAGEREATSAARTEYLANRGTIIPYYEVRIEDFIASFDYNYPDPQAEFGINVYTGHEQVSNRGQNELLCIGLQGKRIAFEDLPPLNIAVVVDKSGSMRDADKLDWIKESLTILLKTLREKDFLSLVAFDDTARVLIPSTQLNSADTRARFAGQIEGLSAGGESEILSGVRLGFQEGMAHFAPEYTNRVLLLTDGWGKAEGTLQTVAKYRERGIELSIVGYGENFDARFAEALVKAGGGSSRFISDRERMEEVFGTGLARTIVPLVRDIRLTVSLRGATVVRTWGYDYQVDPVHRRVLYSVPALHSGDHETILLEINLPESGSAGPRTVAEVDTVYTDLGGASHRLDPIEVKLDFVEVSNPLVGYSDARALKAGSMLHYSLALQQISGDYYYSPTLYNAFFRAYEMKKELKNARMRLLDHSFDAEIDVLEKYIGILGGEIGLNKGIVGQFLADDELLPLEKDRSLLDNLDSLFRELLLSLEQVRGGSIAVSGFSMSGQQRSAFLDLLNEEGAAQLARLSGSKYTVVERNRLDAILSEQELALSDLVEPNQAIQVGKILAANYLVTGTVIPASESVVIFSRIINVETAVIESVAQVVVPRTEEVESLLKHG